MLLDIDIRISNDEGVQVQRFTKHFDSKFDGSNITDENNSIGKSFHEFLSEYLSGSGRLIRDNLLDSNPQNQAAPVRSVNGYSMLNGPDYNPENYAAEVEYTLKLGDSQLITGHIPINKLFKLSRITSITDNISNTQQTQHTQQTRQAAIDTKDNKAVESTENLVLKRNNFKQQIKPSYTLMEVDEMFRCFITNAVERYEDSFFVADYEQSSFVESS